MTGGRAQRSTRLVVLSRSCPPDVGGYQRQFSLVLPRLAERLGTVAVGSVRDRAARPHGWPSVHTIALPGYVLPRRVRGLTDPVSVAIAVAVGLASTLMSRTPCTLLLLSPGMRGSTAALRFWDRRIGPVVARFPTAGDAARVGTPRGPTRSVGVAPGPAQLAEVSAAGLRAQDLPNAVATARRSTGAPQVAVVGRLISRKRVDLIIDAWTSVASGHPGWSLEIVGGGQHERDAVEGALRAQVARTGSPRVTFHGEVSEPWTVVGDASVFVIASEREGSPNAVLEALARGIAVVAPRAAMSAWFDPVPPHAAFDDETALAQVLDELLRDGARRSELADEGRRFIRDHHDPEVVTGRWTALLSPPATDELRAGWSRHRMQIPSGGLVLDVGSGRYPNERADVLCDRDIVRGDRVAVVDRPFVIADAAALPFRTGAFDASIASHLLEHVQQPASVVAELQRVAATAYMETPHRRFERCSPERNHLWAVRVRDGQLVFAPNRWAAQAGLGWRARFAWLYYAGEAKDDPTLRLPGPANSVLRAAGRVVRGVLNRLGVTTARVELTGAGPPRSCER